MATQTTFFDGVNVKAIGVQMDDIDTIFDVQTGIDGIALPFFQAIEAGFHDGKWRIGPGTVGVQQVSKDPGLGTGGSGLLILIAQGADKIG